MLTPRDFTPLFVSAGLLLTGAFLRADDNTAPAEIQVGERLSREIRFTHYFARESRGDVNAELLEGEPSQDYVDTDRGPLKGAFAGLANNCRSCHPANEYIRQRGMRGYADMSARSPVERREDGMKRTLRNSPAFIDIGAQPTEYPLFHFDGEFSNLRELTVETMAGRHYGWLPGERDAALKQIVKVIREDKGLSLNQNDDGGSYASVFAGGPEVTERLLLPERYRLDVAKATDARILDRIGELVEVYMHSLQFARDEDGLYSGSPYDAFLAANNLPRKAEPGESPRAYSRRLLEAVERLEKPVFIDDIEREMVSFMEPKSFRFDAKAFAGMKIFLREPDPKKPGATATGNCASCHTPPSFTDLSFHNTGASQAEYDSVHGVNAFARLVIPKLRERAENPKAYLPANAAMPDAQGPFAAIPEKRRPGRTDLGVWNVFANPTMPRAQEALRFVLARGRKGVSDEQLLDESVGLFKTPTLRLLGQSEPYLHDGSRHSLASVVLFYEDMFAKAASGSLRNASPEMIGPRLDYRDRAALVAFLESLNEDYF